jgi:hypothetical protein|nr:MAG TPA: hypothetical protein [Bacteriophage sp.]
MGCSNTTNLAQVDGGIRVKQGDLSSTFGFELQDENFRGITSLEGQEALITLTKGKYCWKTKALVKDQSVSFNLDSILPSGKYRVEISVGGYIFPSDRKTYIEIETSDKELVLEVVHTLKELDVAEEVKRQLSEGGACPEIPDLLFYYNLGKV